MKIPRRKFLTLYALAPVAAWLGWPKKAKAQEPKPEIKQVRIDGNRYEAKAFTITTKVAADFTPIRTVTLTLQAGIGADLFAKIGREMPLHFYASQDWSPERPQFGILYNQMAKLINAEMSNDRQVAVTFESLGGIGKYKL